MRAALPALAALILAAVFVPYLYISTSDSPDGSIESPAAGEPAGEPVSEPEYDPSPTALPRPVAETPDISGRWTDSEGSVFVLTQSGSMVELTGTSTDGVVFHGTGTRKGRRLTMQIAMAGLVTGQLALELSADGRRLEGAITGPEGSSPVALQR